MAGFAIRFTSPSRNPATAKPARGKGAKGGRKAASLAARSGASGSVTPLPFPSSSPCCPGFFCERRGQNSATCRVGLEESAPDPGLPRTRCGGWGFPVEAEASVLTPSVGAGPARYPDQGQASQGQTCPGRERAFVGL
jgi:hypothetical protein